MPKTNSDQIQVLRVALYIRVSSDEQAKSGDSIRDQRETGIQYIETHRQMSLQDVYIDDGVSGQKLERDDFTRLIKSVQTNLVDLIIFTKLDRWFRSLRHYLNTQAVLEKYNVAWTAINQPYFDTSTPYGRAFVAQSMTWAELEAQNGGMRVRDVFKNKVAHGEVITGKVPRGYQIENKHLVPSKEAPIILDIFNEMKRTQSMSATLRYMKNTHGMVMSLTNLKESILTNETYIGRYRNNENFCPKLIPDELFGDIQEIFYKRQNIKSGCKYPYIFSGLLSCGECNKKLSGCHINVKTTKHDGSIYRYKYPAYECKQFCQHKCSNGGEIRETKIEAYLLAAVRQQMTAHAADYILESAPVHENHTKKASIEKKLERLKTLYINELISLEEYKSDWDELQHSLSSTNEIKSTQTKADEIKNLQMLLNSGFESIYATFENEEKRLFWRCIIREIQVKKSNGSNRGNREFLIYFL